MGFSGSSVGQSGPPQALALSVKVQGQFSSSRAIEINSPTQMMQFQLSCCNNQQEVSEEGVAVLPGQSKVRVSSPKPTLLRPVLVEWAALPLWCPGHQDWLNHGPCWYYDHRHQHGSWLWKCESFIWLALQVSFWVHICEWAPIMPWGFVWSCNRTCGERKAGRKAVHTKGSKPKLSLEKNVSEWWVDVVMMMVV